MIPTALLALAVAPGALAETWTPTAVQESMYHALSIRDPAPSCETVEALSQNAQADLLVLVDKAQQPPWVGMRAANCLVTRHAEASQAALATWVVDADKRGLAIMVLNGLDEMPPAVAKSLAQAALAGPLVADAQKRIAQAESAELQALVPTTP